MESDAELRKMLKERVLEFISQHPEGLMMTALEKHFGETRMRLGYIIQKLEEDGKVQKLDSTIFPHNPIISSDNLNNYINQNQ
jgi:endonuclease V-like protein UPF0215 family